MIPTHIEDGPDPVLPVMSGWAGPMPAWSPNLRAHPDTVVELAAAR